MIAPTRTAQANRNQIRILAQELLRLVDSPEPTLVEIEEIAGLDPMHLTGHCQLIAVASRRWYYAEKIIAAAPHQPRLAPLAELALGPALAMVRPSVAS